MYDALTPLFDQVTDADLLTKFKSERFGVGPDGPARPEARAARGRARSCATASTCRTSPASRATTSRGRWAGCCRRTAGCCSPRRRYAARLAAIDAPNIDAFGLVDRPEAVHADQAGRPDDPAQRARGAASSAGADGKAVLHDIDVYVAGPQRAAARPTAARAPFTRVDMFAANALVGQIFGQGGGDEARRSRVPRRAAQAARHRRAGRRCSTTSPSSTTPTRRRR